MNAVDRIAFKESQARYKKVGRKYILCNDYDAYEGLRDGWWLVKVAPSVKTMRAMVYPAKAELTAAIREKEDQIMDAIRKASEARPRSIPLSEQAKKDWEWFIARNGKEFSTLEYPSMQENAENILKILLEK